MPPDELEDEEHHHHHHHHETSTALTRMPPPVKQYRAPTPKPVMAKESKPEPKLKKQESLKPKSLAETKKASMEITTDIVEEESVSSMMTFLY